MIRAHLALLRPYQYVKNTFLFFPAFFAGRMGEPEVWLRVSLGFLGFSLIASAVYILNDYWDREQDRRHPEKRLRPLAAGTVQPWAAFVMMGVAALLGLSIFAALDKYALYLVSAYVLLNILYSLRLKHIPILDIFVIALGFVIRIGVGAMVVQAHIPLSMWLVLMTFLGALFLGLAKRRDDVLLAQDGLQVRKSIDGYNLAFINGAMILMASVLVVAYISYTISPDVVLRVGKLSYLTVGFVLLGILRYLQITFVEEKSGNPSRILLQDRFLQLTILGWVLAFVSLLYGHMWWGE